MMGMPIIVEVVDPDAAADDLTAVFDYFQYVDDTFSTYKDTSEITAINQQRLTLAEASTDMKAVFALSEQTKQETNGYFDIYRNGQIDPSGLVKGWAIYNAAQILRQRGRAHFYVDAGGDIEASGLNANGTPWRVGIQNPFNPREIVKVLEVTNCGVATSGTYVRGNHIYNPKEGGVLKTPVVSLTVIGPNIYDADRFATAAFAMGITGIYFIENLDGFEGYQIDQNGLATFTSGFGRYVV